MNRMRKLQDLYGSRLDGLVFGAITMALVLVAGVLVVRSTPRPEVELQLADGSVWLPSTAIGGVSLLDGSSGSIATSLGVADQGDQFDVVQWGSDAVLVNETTGSVSRLDGANWSIATGRVRFGEPGSNLTVLAGRNTGWIVQSGSVAPLDLETLSQRSAAPVSSALAEGLVADDGSLLYSSTAPDEPMRRFSTDGRSSVTIADMTGPVALRDLGGFQAGVDLSEQRVWIQGSGIVCQRLAFPDGAKLGVGGADGRLLVVSDQGGLMMWSPAESGCPAESEFLSLGAGQYGTPVVTEGWAAIPEFSRGEIVVVDLITRTLVSRQAVPGLVAGTSFELITETGAVWYNDPTSPVAGLIRRDGEIVAVAKYEEGSDSGFVAAPVDGSPDDQSVALANGDDASNNPLPDASGQSITTTTQAGPDPLGPTLEAPTTTLPGISAPSSNPTNTSTTTPSGTTPPSTAPGTTAPGSTNPIPTTTTPGTTTPTPTIEPPVLDIQLAATASQIEAGGTITFQSVTVTGNPRFFDLQVSPNTGSLEALISFGRFDYTFPTSGVHLVTLTACDPDDVCVSETVSITVIPSGDTVDLVAAVADLGEVTVGEPVTFFDASQGDPVGWSWNFAGGTPASSASQNPSSS